MARSELRIRVEGAGPLDTCYGIKLDGVDVTWNVTRITRDLHKFPLVSFPTLIFEPDFSGVDRAKLDFFRTRPDILALPIVCIEGPRKGEILCPCDGNHRGAARYELRKAGNMAYDLTEAYLVPLEIEAGYRVNIIIE